MKQPTSPYHPAYTRMPQAWLARLVVLLLLGMASLLSGDAQFLRQSPPAARGMSLGSERAMVMVVEYGDFQCPACRQFAATVLPRLVWQYVESGRVRLEFHHFIVFPGVASLRAAEASECASEQDRFWGYYRLLYADVPQAGMSRFSDTHLRNLAAQSGLDMQQFSTCLTSSKYNQRVINAQIAANALHLPGTPTVFVNGNMVANPFDYSQLQGAIEEALRKLH